MKNTDASSWRVRSQHAAFHDPACFAATVA